MKVKIGDIVLYQGKPLLVTNVIAEQVINGYIFPENEKKFPLWLSKISWGFEKDNWHFIDE